MIRQDATNVTHRTPSPVNPRKRKSPSPSRLLPSPEIEAQAQAQGVSTFNSNDVGLAISRPRSALHRGDFNGDHAVQAQSDVLPRTDRASWISRADVYATSPVAPWHRDFPLAATRNAPTFDILHASHAASPPSRPRAFSQASISGNFSYQPPTSPLVHQANAADIPDIDRFMNGSSSPDKGRRHTFSPRSLQNALGGAYAFSTQRSSNSPLGESFAPYQAHQPRRSVTSGSLPQTPFVGNRRPSITGGSPLQRSMVGSFEESILRGRMSSTPSMPLSFTAQIGVLGTGDCKPSLKCPSHITVPFEAHFYSYGSSNNVVDPQPSPYVGTVELEKSPEAARPRDRSKNRRRQLQGQSSSHTSRANSQERNEPLQEDSEARRRRKAKQKRRTNPAMDPPKGGYRIPAKGQLQIVIKNPHKTAVKLFLIPYDVSDIQPGQKTFLRQRSYSAGPIIDMPMDARKNLGTDRPEASLGPPDKPQDKPVLRYLIHLHICCSSRGRVYLYRSIRVVFANRVPDGKEKLRNEMQLPNPKYSVYKPAKEATSTSLQARADEGQRRLSVVETDTFGGYINDRPKDDRASSFPWSDTPVHRETTPSFRFPELATVVSRPASRGVNDMELDMDGSVKSPSSPLSPLERVRSPGNGDSFTFSRSSSQERPLVRAESLLSKRLRDLEMQGRNNGQ